MRDQSEDLRDASLPPPSQPEATDRLKQPSAPFDGLRELLDMIKFEHTIFALPFALLGMLAAAQGMPSWRTLILIVLAMVGARTAAMTCNRIVDESIDAANPRTRTRALPDGRVHAWAAWLMLGLSITLFGFVAGLLGPLPWKLAPIAMIVLLGYSFCKRFTSWSHVVLGAALAGAPVGAWIAVTGAVDPPAWSLALGVLTWTAGFDILYALQDEGFDRSAGLHSIPARFGTRTALWLSRAFHVVATVSWAYFNVQVGAHLLPWLAWISVTMILMREQWVVRDGSLDRINHAFFTLNSFVGPLFFAGHFLEWLMSRSWA